ncbi:hypothetical protein F5X68DRAFT_268554 [Plectosphaerella plurivora]|uniref:Glycosyltransferase family 28 N-terminal domain-containing protein n=1 Tax=Plectosphaerella plurivora TaxID=936078 RepID=A0A9P9A8V2_9PEZI|nr:hypothetical protein F5X68DRAFT_268554 [Plectosphaerella plurivora]
MVSHVKGGAGSSSAPRPPSPSTDRLVSDGFSLPDLEANQDAPPAYGELHDRVQFSQAGMQAGARVTDDGRVNINISQKNSRLAELLAPAIRNQLSGDAGAPPDMPPGYIPPGMGPEPGQPPPPPMNIVIQIVGSRGDVQPFVALGKVLLTYGHRVRLATHATFKSFVEDAGLEFFSIGGDPAELMAFMVKNPGLMPGFDAVKSGEITKRRRGIQDILLGCWRSCIEAGDGLGPPPKRHPRNQPIDASNYGLHSSTHKPFVADAIIANPPSFAHIHIAEKMGIPLHMMFTMPWSPTRAFPHPLANIQSTNTDTVMTSYMSYALVEMMTWQGLGDVINNFREKALDLEPISLIWAPGMLTRLRIPYTYCWSPALIPKPNDWSNTIDVAGFFFLNLASSFTPEPDLAAFLRDGPPPVYIGFGSIVVDDPNALTSMIFEAVRLTGVRALVSKGWGGLGADSMDMPEGVFMLGNVPHDWLFKQVSAVCHHGGAGTSAAGIQAGKPTIVVPFFGDQPFWGAMVKRAGAGPDPIPYKELTAEKLAAAIKVCLETNTQERAQELGSKIREEQGDVEGGKSFHRHLDVEKLRCSIAPSRTAAWRVRRTRVRLSPFAASVLVKAGKIKYADLKLYRPKEYITEGQPWDPISAVTCSLVGDISSIAMGVADFPRELFKSRKSKEEGSPPESHKEASASKESLPVGSTASNPAGSIGGGPSSVSLLSSTSGKPSASTDNLAKSQSQDRLTPTPYQQKSDGQGPNDGPFELPGQDGDASKAQGDPSVASPRRPLTPSSSVFSVPTISNQTDLTTTESLHSSNSREPISPRPSRLTPKPEDRSRRRSPSTAPTVEETMERALAASESVGKIVTTGVKSPMNFCLGLAKGFRNVPRLYGDDTVRPVEKVTDLPSGLKVAGKEFAFGFYDGISGLATQPLRGAEKEGAIGLVKGFGKGISGLVLKPASAVWALPAYTMQGVHASIRNVFASSVENYIIASRIKQGEDDIHYSTHEEQEDVLNRWRRVQYELRKWHAVKAKEDKEKGVSSQPQVAQDNDPSSPPQSPEQGPPPKTGFFNTLHMSFDERKALHARKEAWKQGNVESRTPPRLPPRTPSGGPADASSTYSADEDAEFERAIQASVAATSAGNADEDAKIEEAIRASVNQVRSTGQGLPGAKGAMDSDDDLQITDEEYQELIERAIQQSMSVRAANDEEGLPEDDEDFQRVLRESENPILQNYDSDHDEDLKRVLEESKQPAGPGGDDEAELRRAIEESMTAHKDEEQRHQAARTEEDIVMEYVKKQSLAEDEYRRQVARGKAKEGDGPGEEDDEDLKRAMEESLRMTEKPGESSGASKPRGELE